ncbi:hypothetical protein [Arthrobacter sp. STN4]|uniref:hypothetical protein n=1 Tax=Arthrobacter sp. STN4 TaxID=2923276 RepID=UPI002119E803|nr:hypothetical protein [Arthrobacter sp. STN4]MCQ9164203.1 hypothetical protein [Arthrobacter sp. STN4]
MTGRSIQANVVGPTLLAERALTEPETTGAVTAARMGRGAAVLHVIRDAAVIGALALEDEVHDEY